MSILLCGQLTADDRAEWLQALRAAAPAEHWVVELDSVNRQAIDIAVVANPPTGSLQNLSGLKLIQSLKIRKVFILIVCRFGCRDCQW